MAKVYTESFKKSDGSVRLMKFVRLSELSPADYTSFEIPAVASKVERKLASGVETVWDLDNKGWRTFNFNTVVKS